MNTLLSNITDITDTGGDECLDVTLYLVGGVDNKNFSIKYEDFTEEEKQTIQNFRTLMISKAPDA